MLRQLIAISCVSVATVAAAEPVALKGSAIKETVKGTLVELDTPAGTKIPVRFTDDGLMSGEAGDLASFLGAPKDRGRWWVEGDKLCTKWFRWFDAERHCVSLEQDGARIFWREDSGEKGTGTITRQPVQAADKAARSSVEAGRMPVIEASIAAPVEVAENAPVESASEAPADGVTAEAPVTLVAEKPAELVRPTYSLGGSNIAEEEAIKDQAIKNQGPVTADAPAAEPVSPTVAAVAPAEPATPKIESSPAAEIAKTETGAKTESSTTVEPAKLSFAGAAALSAAMPSSTNLENIFDPRHRKIKPEAQTQTAKAAAPAPPVAQPAAADAPTNEPPADALRTAAIPSRDRRADRPVAVPTYRVAGVEDNDTLNVRSGPSQYHAQVAAIPPSARGVEITGPCQDLWCPIRRGRVSGWVNSYYLAADAPGTTIPRTYAGR